MKTAINVCNGGFGLSAEAKKNDAGKTRYDLLPPYPLEQLARVFTEGAKEYGEDNWRKGLASGRIYAAIQRHLWKYWSGEKNDSETGISHLAHAAWGCFALLEYERQEEVKNETKISK